MKHTLEEFNALAQPLNLFGSTKIASLRTAYEGFIRYAATGVTAYAAKDADQCCEGMLLALTGLARNRTQASTQIPRLLWLLEALTGVTWHVPKRNNSINFFYVAGSFGGRPNGAGEVFAILNKLESCIDYVNGNEGMASVLSSITTFVTVDISSYVSEILLRYAPVIDALELCSQRIKGSARLTATGSDTHCGGHQAVFLNSGAAKLVYKPRSLDADIAFYKLIQHFNSLVPKACRGIPLPTIAFPTTGGGWGTEHFVKHLERPLTREEARTYYFQMGELAVLASLFGMGDLHQDNLIPSPTGPVIIDAECCLQPDVLCNNQLVGTQIFEALRRCNTADPAKTASSVFQIGTNCSTMVYRQYINNIVDGFDYARQLLNSPGPALLETLMGLRAAVAQIRFVPLATNRFVAMNPGISAEQMAKTDEWIKMLGKLKAIPGISSLNEPVLYTGVVNALERCDIPYFCFVISGDVANLMCENKEIAVTDFYSTDKLRAVLTSNIEFLMSNNAREQLLTELHRE